MLAWLSALLMGLFAAHAQVIYIPPTAGSGDLPFTALHTYFMAPAGASPAGNDSNSGTDAAHPWLTPNHSLVCGDVIVAASGAYDPVNGFQTWGTVSNCPSTTGGIDGTGGIWFATLLCGGAHVGDCNIVNTGTNRSVMDITTNFWAVEGWQVSSTVATNTRAFEGDGCDFVHVPPSNIFHHIAFINTIAFSVNQAYDTNDCGQNHNVPGNGIDYFAVVGSIAQNAANDSICLGAIDVVSPSQFDSVAGTHMFIGGNFAFVNREPTGCTDGEGIMFDTWDAHGVTYQGVIEQNISVGSGRYGLQLFDQFLNSSAPHINVFNNTFFDNFYVTGTDSVDGELNWQPNATNSPWIVTITNNIAQTRTATSPSGSPLYALLVGNPSANTTIGGTGSENIFKGLETSCTATCDSGNNVVAYNGASFGTNTYVDPLFKNTTDLVNNHYGAPSCGSFETTTACMGWNQGSSTVTASSVIDDLTATASQAAGKGYHTPGPCAADSFYPSWLKGVVYLHWNGSSLIEKAGLLTKPCGV